MSISNIGHQFTQFKSHSRLDLIIIEMEMSSFWWNFHHWLHWKSSKWQLPVQPVIKISSKWWHFRFSDDEHCFYCMDNEWHQYKLWDVSLLIHSQKRQWKTWLKLHDSSKLKHHFSEKKWVPSADGLFTKVYFLLFFYIQMTMSWLCLLRS